jgi:cytochrome c
MRGTCARLIVSLSALSVVVAPGSARSDERADGQALYLANCSNCHGVLASAGHGTRLNVTPVSVTGQLAVALPPGPTLTGVVGREAGTVPGYQYSRAFLAALRGVVWTRATLDRWITDTREWVPGAFMVYRQPDPEIRARIIDYLERAASEPASEGTAPERGGDTRGAGCMALTAIRR